MLIVLGALSLSPTEPAARLDALIAARLEAPVGAQGRAARRVDPTVRLPACPVEPIISASLRRVAVACQPRGWRFAPPRLAPAALKASAAAEPSAASVVVRKGDQLTVAAGRSGFAIDITVTAQDDGAAGDVIDVLRADGTRLRVCVRVTDAGAGVVADEP